MANSTRVATLYEVVAALDRRRPRVGHPAEAAIGEDAAALKAQALEQIAALDDA
jgi:hypothetical protein